MADAEGNNDAQEEFPYPSKAMNVACRCQFTDVKLPNGKTETKLDTVPHPPDAICTVCDNSSLKITQPYAIPIATGINELNAYYRRIYELMWDRSERFGITLRNNTESLEELREVMKTVQETCSSIHQRVDRNEKRNDTQKSGSKKKKLLAKKRKVAESAHTITERIRGTMSGIDEDNKLEDALQRLDRFVDTKKEELKIVSQEQLVIVEADVIVLEQEETVATSEKTVRTNVATNQQALSDVVLALEKSPRNEIGNRSATTLQEVEVTEPPKKRRRIRPSRQPFAAEVKSPTYDEPNFCFLNYYSPPRNVSKNFKRSQKTISRRIRPKLQRSPCSQY